MDYAPLNESVVRYWKHTRFSTMEVNRLCGGLDADTMAARIYFSGDGNAVVTVSQKTWDRQQGHYPTIANLFKEIANHPRMKGAKGTLLVWLEDGMWLNQKEWSSKIPILAFGRHRFDELTALIPDPAFLKSNGYRNELEELSELVLERGWSERIPTAFWRGTSTGCGIESPDWPTTPRGLLTLFSKEWNNSQEIDAKFSRLANIPEPQATEMNELDIVGEHTNFTDFTKYRYQIDVDGYCCAWRSLFLKLGSGSVTLKIQSDYEQWYFSEFMPWRDYIPLEKNLRDFSRVYEWLKNHDYEASLIAESGRSLTSKISYDRSVDQVAALCAALMESCEE